MPRSNQNRAKNIELSSIDGPRLAGEILNHLPPQTRARIIEQVAKINPLQLAKIEESVLRFEKIAQFSRRSLQTLLKKVEEKDLLVALKKSSPDIKEALLVNVSAHKRKELEEELSAMPPVRLEEVEHAQDKIMRTLNVMRDKGEAILAAMQDGKVDKPISKHNFWA
jgi:flagellar motor switch protein FliG